MPTSLESVKLILQDLITTYLSAMVVIVLIILVYYWTLSMAFSRKYKGNFIARAYGVVTVMLYTIFLYGFFFH